MVRIGLAGTSNVAWYEKWWVSSFPILFLVLTVVAFSIYGDVVRDVLNPQEGAQLSISPLLWLAGIGQIA